MQNVQASQTGQHKSHHDGYEVVNAIRKRPKLLSAWFEHQRSEGSSHPLTLIKARVERLGSKFMQAKRLVRVRKSLISFVGKRVFKTQFAKKKKEQDLKNKIREIVKNPEFWVAQKQQACDYCKYKLA